MTDEGRLYITDIQGSPEFHWPMATIIIIMIMMFGIVVVVMVLMVVMVVMV